MLNVRVHGEPHCVSATWVHDESPWKGRGVASASFMGGSKWWIDRVLVQPGENRRQGIGSAMMRQLQEALKRRGATEVEVCPGGYDISFEEQVAFYEAVGFVKKDECTWVYRPDQA